MKLVVPQQPFEIELHLPVKTYDIDFAGFVSNIVYVRWLEDLRLEVLARHFPLDEQLKRGMAPVIVQTKVEYKQPIQLADAPSGRMWLKTMESVRWTVSAVISINGKVAALGEQIGIFIDLRNRKPIRIPEELRQRYRELSATTQHQSETNG